MRIDTSARQFIQDYKRRNIGPDELVQVTQGWVALWLVGGAYAAELRIGTISMAGESLYINTYSAQEIADDICPAKDLELAVGIASISGAEVN